MTKQVHADRFAVLACALQPARASAAARPACHASLTFGRPLDRSRLPLSPASAAAACPAALLSFLLRLRVSKSVPIQACVHSSKVLLSPVLWIEPTRQDRR